jgi:hypothetical protein
MEGGFAPMATKTDRRPKTRAETTPKRPSEPLPTWRNTRPRGNPEPDRQDLARSRERFEALLGR